MNCTDFVVLFYFENIYIYKADIGGFTIIQWYFLFVSFWAANTVFVLLSTSALFGTDLLQNTYIWHYWQLKQKSPKYETAKYCLEFSYTISNRWTHTLSVRPVLKNRQNKDLNDKW